VETSRSQQRAGFSVGDRPSRLSLRRRDLRGSARAALTAAFVLGVPAQGALAARALGPDPSPPQPLAAGGLRPDAVSAPGVAAAAGIAPAFAPARAPIVRVDVPRPSSHTAVVQEPAAPRDASAPSRFAAVARAQPRATVAPRPTPKPQGPAQPLLLALRTGSASPTPGAALAPASAVAAVARVATLEVPSRERGPLLPAALAFLVLAIASGSFLSLVYRVHGERIEL